METNSNNKDRKPTFTKKDISKRIAEAQQVNLDVASQWVDSVIAAMREVMLTADPELRIEIRDFGVFEVKLTKSKPKARFLVRRDEDDLAGLRIPRFGLGFG